MSTHKKSSKSKSRKATPWDEKKPLTATQEFLKMQYKSRYEERHRPLNQTGEADMINSYEPKCCPFCGSETFSKYGHDKNGINRFECSCGKYFKPTTGTIFDSRKIGVCEWIEYCLNIFRYVSLNADSWNNRNAFSTSKYWLEKLFLTLENSQDNVILEGEIWLDETYYPVIMRDLIKDSEGRLLRGLSRNQICIGAATDKKHTVCFFEGFAKPTQSQSYDTFKDHIAPGSTIIHDKEYAHKKLVRELSLKSKCYSSKEMKGLADSENPLYPINRIHNLLKMFLNAHSGFNRDELQGYLNLYSFVINEPEEHLEKVEKIINLVFENSKSLRYRDQFR